MRTFRTSPLWVLMVLLWGALPARAADDDAQEVDDPADVRMARARFEEGVKYYDAGRFDEARAAFLQAYALRAHPAVLLNVAQSELRGGRSVDAAVHFSEYLIETAGHDQKERDVAEQGLREAKREVAEVHVLVDVPGAEIFVDGQSVGHAPLGRSLFLLPGVHQIRAQGGDRVAHSTVTADAALDYPVELKLSPPRAPVSLPPSPSLSPPPAALETETDLASPADQRAFGTWLTSSPVGIAGLVMTGTGLALGTTATLVANHRYRAANDTTRAIVSSAEAENQTGVICSNGSSPLLQYQGACSERQRQRDQGDTWRALAIGGFVGAAAAAAGTIVYYLVEPSAQVAGDAPGPSGPTLVPLATRELRGLSIVGTF